MAMDIGTPDGNRMLMVAQELVMALFCLLYAYPHVPSRIIDDKTSTTWFSVGSQAALRLAINNLLQTSEVLLVCLAPGVARAELTWESACDPDLLDELLDLQLYHDDVPISCQQMFHDIATLYTSVTNVQHIGTRENMLVLFKSHQLLRPSFTLPSDRSDRTGLLRFCSEQTVEWLQPYFAAAPLFLYPMGLLTARCDRDRR